MQVLNGHTSPETSYLVVNYPFGFKPRCVAQHWIETKKGFGQRHVSRTSHKSFNTIYTAMIAAQGQTVADEWARDQVAKGLVLWNKEKAGIYGLLVLLGLDENGHVGNDAFNLYGGPEAFDRFRNHTGLSEETVKLLDRWEISSRKFNPLIWDGR